MKRKVAVILSLTMVISLLFCGIGFAEEAEVDEFGYPLNPTEHYELTLGTINQGVTPAGMLYDLLKQEIEERSHGAITLSIFDGGTLGTEQEMAESVLLGSLDIGQINAAMLTNYIDNANILTLPYLFSDREQVKAVCDEFFDEILEGCEEAIGLPVDITEQGWRMFTNTKRTVAKLEDFAGLTVRVQDGQIYFDTFNALGCIPTSIAMGELVTAMQQGVCDAHENPLATNVNLSMYEFAKYITLTRHLFGTNITVLSAEVKNKLPEMYYDLLMQIFDEYRYYSFNLGEELKNSFIETLTEKGVEITILEDSELARIRETVAPVWENFDNQDLLERILAFEEEYSASAE